MFISGGALSSAARLSAEYSRPRVCRRSRSSGDEVLAWKIGQRVFGITAGGAQAEFVVAPENHLAEIPENLDWSEAAAVPEVFITAHDALFTRANLRPGETMLVHAAGSGVGTAAIQLTHAAGAVSVWYLAHGRQT